MDIFLRWNPETGAAEWSATGTDLETAVIASLFTDASASPDFAADDPRGWWATAYQRAEWGSRLWQLDRAKKTDATLALAIGEARRSLQWLIDDGAASAVDVAAEWQGTRLALAVTVSGPSGVNVFRFAWAWNQAGV